MARVIVTVYTTLHGEVSVDQHFHEIVAQGASDALDMSNLRRSVGNAAQAAVNAHRPPPTPLSVNSNGSAL